MIIFFILNACSGNTNELQYYGKPLEIGVIGDYELPELFVDIKYIKIDFNQLIENDKKYDAILITEDVFWEADKDKYVSFFNDIDFPVFFIGMEGFQDFAFTTEGINLNMSRTENSAYIQGFKNANKLDSVHWHFYLDNENKDYKKELLLKVFELLD